MRKTLFTVATLALLLVRPVFAEVPPVAVSIKPLHGLVAMVMQGVGEPALIVAGNASPHSYALKPSDARALAKARLVVWVGPRFEGFLAKPLKGRQDTLAITAVPGMTLLEGREGGVWEVHHDGAAHHHDDETDGHLWLDPDNAARLVAAVAERLATLDPAHASAYRANAEAAGARIAEVDAGLAARLKPLAGRPYVVFHDAYQYLETRYGLTPVGAITVDPDRPPSAKRMGALRDRLKGAGVTCVFREPQFAGRTVEALAQSAGARVGVLDPEGGLVDAGPDAWVRIMTGLGDSLSECLSGG
jgi:zinc transport system substrate-binding protein